MNLKKFDLFNDIYYQKEYIALYLKDKEEIFEFRYKENGNTFYNIAIKRPILSIGNIDLNKTYYDLETAYGYGGYYSDNDGEDFLSSALKKYQEYCIEENIIAEFIRFHPFNDIHNFLNNYFDLFVHDRDTIYVDASLSKEERWKKYSSKMRNILRKCEKELIFKKSNDIESFISLYEKTMRRNVADDFYFFDKSYFQELITLNNIELYEVLYNEIVISSSFFMFSEDYGHYHLSANNYEYRKHNANYYILDSIFDIAYQRGIKQFLLGGGRTNLDGDLLLKFKEKFSSLKKNFYIAGKIYNKKIYEEYVNIWQEQSEENIKYFLKYRLGI